MTKEDFEKMAYADLGGYRWHMLMGLDVEKVKEVARDIASRKAKGFVKNRKDRKQFIPEEKADNVGLGGELAFSRFAAIAWNKADPATRHEGDCEFNIEVKTLTQERTWPFVPHTELRLTRPFVFATGYLHPVYEFVGWQWGEFIKDYPGTGYWDDCYRLHKDLLLPIETLLRHIGEWKELQEFQI